MQFTVLIEFLIPGLATVLLCLALLPGDAVQQMRQVVPTGDAALALVLLAVSYPVGHLVNFPLYRSFQLGLLAPRARRRTFKKYLSTGVDLAALASQVGFRVGADTKEGLRHLFDYMQTMIYCRNIEQFSRDALFYKSLQRLARGMLLPLILFGVLYFRHKELVPFSLLGVLLILYAFIVCILLWAYFLQVEEDEIARFFITLTVLQPTAEVQPTRDLNQSTPLRGAVG